jgi:hypothetical protein
MINEFIQKYEQVKEDILNNSDLSKTGKKKRLAEFEKLKRNEARELIKELRNTAVIGYLAIREAKQLAKFAKEKELMETDFSRLLYMSMVAKAQIEGRNISEIKDTWQNVKESEDDYLIRAWKETLPGVIRAKEYKDITKEKPGLLEDIESVQTVKEMGITDTEKGALKTLYEVKEDARKLDNLFNNNGGIERRVMSGIHLDGDKVEAEFEQKIIVRPGGEAKKETPEELIERLEAEYKEKAEYVKNKFNSDIDIDFEDVSGGVYETKQENIEH